MEFSINHEKKLVEVWLTNDDQKNTELLENLRHQYKAYREKKYMVAEFHSGTSDLYACTRDLLLYNRKRIAELETLRQKATDVENNSAI